jgi:hypothetical protein
MKLFIASVLLLTMAAMPGATEPLPQSTELSGYVVARDRLNMIGNSVNKSDLKAELFIVRLKDSSYIKIFTNGTLTNLTCLLNSSRPASDGTSSLPEFRIAMAQSRRW